MFKLILFDDNIKVAECKSRNPYNVLGAILYLIQKKYR